MTDAFRRELAALPDQFLREPRPEGGALPPGGRVVIAGMGGSALAADFAALRLEDRREIRVIRDEVLPPWVGEGDAVLCLSHSGNTGETLAIWEEAGTRGLARGAVASGGLLLDRAREAGTPRCAVPGDLSPRSSLGVLLRGALALLGFRDDTGLWEETASVLRRVGETWPKAPDLEEDVEPQPAPAAELAWQLHRNLAVLVALEPGMVPVARRWAGDLSENAKAPAIVWEFPECDHNAIMVYAEEAVPAIPLVPVILGSPRHPRRVKRWNEVRSLLADRGASLIEVEEPHEDPWIEALALAHVGDWVSVLLAELEGIPAGSLSLMDELKSRLG